MAETGFDAMFEAAVRRGEAARERIPVPTGVRYDADSGRIVIDFANGAAFLIPARSLQGLEDASDKELSEVTMLGETGLHWESRDVDFSIAGLMAGTFGTARFMEISRKGGQSRSEAKAAAARRNGARGGRPRKNNPPAPVATSKGSHRG